MNFLLAIKNFFYHTEKFIIESCSDFSEKVYETGPKTDTKIETIWKTRSVPYSYNIGSGKNCVTVNLTRFESYPETRSNTTYTPSQKQELSTFCVIGPTGKFYPGFDRNGAMFFKLFSDNNTVNITRLFNVDFIYKFGNDKYVVNNILTDWIVGSAIVCPCFISMKMEDLRIIPAMYTGMAMTWLAIHRNA